MKNRSLQIDVIRPMIFDLSIFECKLIINGRAARVYMSNSDYQRLIAEGVFIRDGKTSDSSGVINTTRVWEEKD
jgi:hypothetical protein